MSQAEPFNIAGIGGMKTVGETGRSGATICLHGGPGGSCQTLYPFFPSERISGAWYFADIPNHGVSAGTDGDWSPGACIERLERFAEELEGPLRVAGLSWGANVAVECAAAHPGRFESLVGISGAGSLEEIARHQSEVGAQMAPEIQELMGRLQAATGEEVRALSAQLWEETLPIWMAGNPGLEVYLEGTRGFSSDPQVAAAYIESWLMPRLNPDQLQALFRALEVPVLLVRGLDDRMGNELSGMDPYIDDPSVEVLLLENAGHCPFVDQPEVFFRAVEAFFDRVSGVA